MQNRKTLGTTAFASFLPHFFAKKITKLVFEIFWCITLQKHQKKYNFFGLKNFDQVIYF